MKKLAILRLITYILPMPLCLISILFIIFRISDIIGTILLLIGFVLIILGIPLEYKMSAYQNTVFFAILKPTARIPERDEENAGYDIYPCFNEKYIVIKPHETELIPTGIASAFDSKYVFVLKERGSTGMKGIAQRSGIIDSGYRNEWLVPITNTTDKVMFISKLSQKATYESYYGETMLPSFVYPYDKAICQALLLPVPKVKVQTTTYSKLLDMESERGLKGFGSSGK